MKLVKPSVEFLDGNSKGLQLLEIAGRTCYKSEDRITDDSAGKFVEKLLSRGHEAMIEFGWLCYRVVCDRGVTHEIVRHRIASYAQESTRYCDYEGSGIVLIHPDGLTDDQRFRREQHFWVVQELYDAERSEGVSPQIARGILPNALKTEIVIGMNIRELRHFFKLRTASGAHPQMQEVAKMMLADAKMRVPVVFDEYGE